MKKTDEINAILVLIDSLKADISDWEKAGSPICRNGTDKRVGATRTGIKSKIRMVRSMLNQMDRDI